MGDMIMSNRLRELSENVRRLAETAAFPREMKAQAEAVRDLLDLAADWPVPRSLNLDGDIRVRLPGLCRSSGSPLCGAPCSVAPSTEASGIRCPDVTSAD